MTRLTLQATTQAELRVRKARPSTMSRQPSKEAAGHKTEKGPFNSQSNPDSMGANLVPHRANLSNALRLASKNASITLSGAAPRWPQQNQAVNDMAARKQTACREITHRDDVPGGQGTLKGPAQMKRPDTAQKRPHQGRTRSGVIVQAEARPYEASADSVDEVLLDDELVIEPCNVATSCPASDSIIKPGQQCLRESDISWEPKASGTGTRVGHAAEAKLNPRSMKIKGRSATLSPATEPQICFSELLQGLLFLVFIMLCLCICQLRTQTLERRCLYLQ